MRHFWPLVLVLQPAEDTPLTALALAELAARAGVSGHWGIGKLGRRPAGQQQDGAMPPALCMLTYMSDLVVRVGATGRAERHHVPSRAGRVGGHAHLHEPQGDDDMAGSVTHMPRHRLTPWPTGWQVRKVSFTGSTRVGKVLMRECASTVKKVRGKRLPTNTHIGGASFPLSPGREGGGLRP